MTLCKFTPGDAKLAARSRPILRNIAWALGLCGLIVALQPLPVHADATDDYNVAIQFYKQERWDIAARSFRTFLKDNARHPQAPAARLYLGQALVQQRKFNEARDVFREYVKLNADAQDVALARFRVAECSYFLQEDKPALREVDEYLDRHPGHELVPRARLYRGQTQLRLNDDAGAAETLTLLIEKKPDPTILAEAQYALASAQEALGKSDAAIAIYEQLAGNPESPFAADAQFRLASIAFTAADYARAAERFAALADKFPEHQLAATATLNAGYAEFSQGHNDAALTHFTKAASNPQQAATAGMWIGLTHKQAGDLERAATAFRSVYEKDDQQPLAEKLLFHWADCELRLADYPEARRLFVTVADRWSDGERGDDSLHLATEAALRAGDLADAEQLNQRFETQHATSSLRWRQQVLGGRVQLARGDALRTCRLERPGGRRAFSAGGRAVVAWSRNPKSLPRDCPRDSSSPVLTSVSTTIHASSRPSNRLPRRFAPTKGVPNSPTDYCCNRTISIALADTPMPPPSPSCTSISRPPAMHPPPGASSHWRKSISTTNRPSMRLSTS
jgi:TolA-binding protein